MKLCMIGCGALANNEYAPSLIRYKKENPAAEYAACCDLDQEKAGLFRQKVGFQNAYGDYFEMIEKEKPDAVIMVTPVQFTAKIACDVIGTGCTVMMEKPIGIDFSECSRIVEAAEKNGVHTQAAFNRRHSPLIRALMKELAANPAPIRHIDYRLYRINRKDANFETTSVHGIDAARYIVGSDYANVHFSYQSLAHIANESSVNLLMHGAFQNGCTLQLSFYPISGANLERITVIRDKETFFVNLPFHECADGDGSIVKYEDGRKVFEKFGPDVSDGPLNNEQGGFYAEVKAFLDAVSAGRKPEHDVRSAADSMRMMDCVKCRAASYVRENN